MAGRFLSTLRTLWRSAFLLDAEPKRLAARQSGAARLVTAARKRVKPARRLDDDGEPLAALVLYREAALLLMRASLAGDGPAVLMGGPDLVLERFCKLVGAENLEAPRLAQVAALLDGSTGDDLDQMSDEQLSTSAADFSVLTGWLCEQIDVPSDASRKSRRRWRIGIAAAIALAVTVPPLIWLLSDPNIARGVRVAASSAGYNTKAEDAVDGIHGVLGFHSGLEPSPWLLLDLGKPHALESVSAYGREDCCYDQSVPLAFETSLDGQSFLVVATREKPFSHDNPWLIRLPKTTARFLRFRTKRESYLVLSEVEAHGSKIQ